MPDLEVGWLTGQRLERALPLIRLVAPELSPQDWRDQAEKAFSSGGGVVAVAAEDGLVHGIALFHPCRMLRLGRVLQVDDLITVEMSRKAPVHRLLIETLTKLAHSLNCASLTIAVPSAAFSGDSGGAA